MINRIKTSVRWLAFPVRQILVTVIGGTVLLIGVAMIVLISLANRSIYGLSAYAFTGDLSRAFRLMESLEAGTISINDGLPTTSQSPFGGVKQSGWGRELGSEGLDAFLETRHISLGIEESLPPYSGKEN